MKENRYLSTGDPVSGLWGSLVHHFWCVSVGAYFWGPPFGYTACRRPTGGPFASEYLGPETDANKEVMNSSEEEKDKSEGDHKASRSDLAHGAFNLSRRGMRGRLASVKGCWLQQQLVLSHA